MTVLEPPKHTVAGADLNANGDAAPTEPSDDYKSIIKSVYADLSVSKNWYLVSKKWFDEFIDSFSVTDPTAKTLGPIDNSPLLDESGNFIRSAEENEHFVFVPEWAWKRLVTDFDLKDKSHTIMRSTVKNKDRLIVELHPYELTVQLLVPKTDANETKVPEDKTVSISRFATIDQLYTKIANLYAKQVPAGSFPPLDRPSAIPSDPQATSTDPRMFVANEDELYDNTTYSLISRDPMIELQTHLEHGNRVVIDIPDANGQYNIPDNKIEKDTSSVQTAIPMGPPIPPAPSMPAAAPNSPVKLFGTTPAPLPPLKLMPAANFGSYAEENSFGSTSSANMEQDSMPITHKVTPGLCGLSNLGNTCFMNSGLQCLSNVPALAQYFVTNQYLPEVNSENVLGTGGRLAACFARMLQVMWSGREDHWVPREIKSMMGQIHEDFLGFRQHDSQEMLAILLDRLHEDLNRVKVRKPVSLNSDDELKEHSVQEVADMFWEAHHQMNDSVIVDLLQGQLKSTLTCPDCDRVSITFDPFQFLSVPLPQRMNMKQTNVVYIPPESNLKWMKMDIKYKAPKYTTPAQVLQDAIQEKMNLPSSEKLCLLHWNATEGRAHVVRSTTSIDRLINENNNSDKDDGANSSFFVYRMPELGTEPEGAQPVTVVATQFLKDPTTGDNNAVGWPIVFRTDQQSLTYDTIFASLKRIISVQFADFEGIDDWLSQQNSEEEGEDDVDEDVPSDPQPSGSSERQTTQNDDSSDEMPDMESLTESTDVTSAPADTSTTNRVKRRKNALFEVLKWTRGSGIYASYGNNKMSYAPLTERDGNTNWVHSNDSMPGFDDKFAYVGIQWNPKAYEKFFRKNLTSTLVDYVPPNASDDPMGEDFDDVYDANRPIHVRDCMRLFLKEEKLGSNDTWYCNKCKNHVQALKKFDIVRLPRVLLVHLKRFSNGTYYREKIDVAVDYPVHGLDMSEFVSDAAKSSITAGGDMTTYDLVAVSNHMGGLGDTASAFNIYTRRWHYFDDSRVSCMDESSAMSNAAYVLVYARRGELGNPNSRVDRQMEPNIEMELSD